MTSCDKFDDILWQNMTSHVTQWLFLNLTQNTKRQALIRNTVPSRGCLQGRSAMEKGRTWAEGHAPNTLNMIPHTEASNTILKHQYPQTEGTLHPILNVPCTSHWMYPVPHTECTLYPILNVPCTPYYTPYWMYPVPHTECTILNVPCTP